jgi:uracil-DNA glycosylase
VFTGDRSGDWLYRALHRAGLACLPTSTHRDDGQSLIGAYISSAVRCAPPENKPTPAERDTCRPFFERELALLSDVKVIVCLGRFAYDVVADVIGLRPKPAFGHGVEAALPDGRTVLCSFHPSQQNTFTGKLTEPMFDAIFTRANALAP